MILAIMIASLLITSTSLVIWLRNLRQFRKAPILDTATPLPAGKLSVLVPARNEEANIGACVESILAAEPDGAIEVLVLDDGSTDRTASIVKAIALRDSRVRLASAPPLPEGWCGKQHACHVLSMLARGRWLVFIDADVRLNPGALSRTLHFAKQGNSVLVSGFPRQLTETWLERLLIPMIHFVLLGFLPIWRMRAMASPAYGAGCGQFFAAERQAYDTVGGHASIRTSLHDGVTLPRAFRGYGLRTDIFDATDLATCRMYHSAVETWRGLAKNAIEGLGQPLAIVPWTTLLGVGYVAPAIIATLATVSVDMSNRHLILQLSLTSLALGVLPRLVNARLYRQSIVGALAHPLGVACLLAIQWYALARRVVGAPAAWRGRVYPANA